MKVEFRTLSTGICVRVTDGDLIANGVIVGERNATRAIAFALMAKSDLSVIKKVLRKNRRAKLDREAKKICSWMVAARGGESKCLVICLGWRQTSEMPNIEYSVYEKATDSSVRLRVGSKDCERFFITICSENPESDLV